MTRRPAMVRAGAVALLACALVACATGSRISAAADVHALLLAIRNDDRAAFEAHIDRAALTAEMQEIIVDQARSRLGASGLGLSVLASGPLSRAAAKMVLRPDVLRAIADAFGYGPERPIPGTLSLAVALSPLPDGRVCARERKAGPCLLTFTDEDGVWKLTAFDAGRVGLAAPAAPR
jgi:hypothetical protein